MTTPHSQPVTYPIAQLERRFTAFAVDRLLAWGLLAIVGLVTALFVSVEFWTVVGAVAGAMVLLWLVLAIVLGVSGTSPGKALTGLRVVHHGTGTPIGVGPALLRSLVLGIGGLPTFGIGVATLAWTAVEDRGRQRRGWHDHLANTVVVDVRPVVDVAADVEEGPRHIVNLTAMRLIPAPSVESVRTPERPEHAVRRPSPSGEVATPVAPPQVTAAPVPAAPAPVPPEHSVTQQPSPQQPSPQQPSPQQPSPQQPSPQQPSPQQWAPPAAPHLSPPPPPPTARPPRPPSTWRVRFDNGESFVIAGLALVGRRPEARTGEQVAHLIPLASADMSVSKTHAQFGPAPDGTIVVMDRGSTNGTVLVRQGVSRQLAPGKPAALVHGDKVVYGDREMTITREA
ncbi:RDD family protein [Nocardioides hwasunensis]|uniref:RDD family protein n=1 Tax=Nocardioides hwasunensis TaxID=397258 RepID=A0ABR8MEI5_9ACTN|nr:RDD family protein [Nocardioides hwasunensis]MBD3913960.1 RDD family protein [Nocardioides hwasunensis]